MRDLRLCFIGSGNAFSPGGLCCNGFVVNDRFLFEAPPQALQSLNHLEFDPNQLEAIVLSHHHGDHFLGLPFLLLHFRYRGRTRPLRIIGPAGTEALARQIAEGVFPGVLETPYDLEWTTAQPGTPIHLDGLTIEPTKVVHDERLEVSLGYACSLGGTKFGYTGDTKMCDAVLDLARHSQLLVSECASRDQVVPVHMNLVDDMPVVRNAMAPGAQLILTHIDTAVWPVDLPDTDIARDFETYSL